jgi:hypothetical protein
MHPRSGLDDPTGTKTRPLAAHLIASRYADYAIAVLRKSKVVVINQCYLVIYEVLTAVTEECCLLRYDAV